MTNCSCKSINKLGSTLVESALMICMICMILFGILQVSNLSMNHELLKYASMCGARCATVGLNSIMAEKAVKVALIPVSGKRTSGETTQRYPAAIYGKRTFEEALERDPTSTAATTELLSMPLFLDSQAGYARGVLDYEEWDDQVLDVRIITHSDSDDSLITAKVEKREFFNNFPFARWLFGSDEIDFTGDEYEMRMENHAALYLE